MPNDDGGLQSAAPATKTGTHLLKTSQKYCACHTKRLRHVTKQVWMSRSARPARRNEATRRLKPPKVITFAELATGTAIRPSHGHLRTVADGCGRLNTASTPRPPRVKREPLLRVREKSTRQWDIFPPSPLLPLMRAKAAAWSEVYSWHLRVYKAKLICFWST